MDRFVHPRLPDWTIRWPEFIKDSLDLASELVVDWDSEGITCFSWAAQGCEAITGHNPHDPWIGQYTGVIGICKLLKKHGYTSLDQYVAALFPEVPLSMAQQADWALVKGNYWQEHPDEAVVGEEAMPYAVALCEPPFYYAVTERGLVRGDLYKDGVRAFAVGRSI